MAAEIFELVQCHRAVKRNYLSSFAPVSVKARFTPVRMLKMKAVAATPDQALALPGPSALRLTRQAMILPTADLSLGIGGEAVRGLAGPSVKPDGTSDPIGPVAVCPACPRRAEVRDARGKG